MEKPNYNFRAWDVRGKQMIYDAASLTHDQTLLSTTLDLGGGTSIFNYFDGLIWMQKMPDNVQDVSGSPIFEGDVILVGPEELNNKFVVKFGTVQRRVLSYSGDRTILVDMNCFYFCSLIDGQAYFSIAEMNEVNGGHDLNITKVVGNIYENS